MAFLLDSPIPSCVPEAVVPLTLPPRVQSSDDPISAKFIFSQQFLPDAVVETDENVAILIVKIEKLSKIYHWQPHEHWQSLSTRLNKSAKLKFLSLSRTRQHFWPEVRSIFIPSFNSVEKAKFQRKLNSMKQSAFESVLNFIERYESLFYRANGYEIDDILDRENFVIARCINGFDNKELRNSVRNCNVNTFEQLNNVLRRKFVAYFDFYDLFRSATPSEDVEEQQTMPDYIRKSENEREFAKAANSLNGYQSKKRRNNRYRYQR